MTSESRRFDRSKSLEELEGKVWGNPPWESALVTTCQRLRRKPLETFTVEDLRVMIGQEIGLPFLMPLAIERLEENPLAEGGFYPGDLLKSVLTVQVGFWNDHPDLLVAVERIAARALVLLKTVDEVDRRTAEEALSEAMGKFKRRREKPE